MAQVFPVIGGNGRVIAVCQHEHNAEMAAKKVVGAGGSAEVGDPIPFNPATAKDPEMLAQLVEASLS